MAQNIIYSPWKRTKGPWLFLMTTLLLFSLLWWLYVSALLTSLIKLILWCFPQAKGRQRTWRVARTIWSCSISLRQYKFSLLTVLKGLKNLLKICLFFVCFFFCLVAMCISWLVSPFLHLQSASVQSQHLSSHHLLFVRSPLLPSFDTHDYS